MRRWRLAAGLLTGAAIAGAAVAGGAPVAGEDLPVGERIRFLHEGTPGWAVWPAFQAARERANAAGAAVQERWLVELGDGGAGAGPATAEAVRLAPGAQAPRPHLAPGGIRYALGEADRGGDGETGAWSVSTEDVAAALWEAVHRQVAWPRNRTQFFTGIVLDRPDDAWSVALLEAVGRIPDRMSEFTVRDIVLADTSAGGAWGGLAEVDERERRRPNVVWMLFGSRAVAAAVERFGERLGYAGWEQPVLVTYAEDASVFQELLARRLTAVVAPDYSVLGKRLVRDRLQRWLQRAGAPGSGVPDYVLRRAADLEAAWAAEDEADRALRTFFTDNRESIEEYLRRAL